MATGRMTSMDKVEWWKNFDLNAEVHIAGTFLYDGLQALGHCRRLDNDDEIFSFLYHFSVGCERLMKVVIVLTEHRVETDQKAFEQKLVSHNTEALLQRIEKVHPLKISRPERALVRCLSEFYRTYRYDHFRLETIRDRGQMREKFRVFLETDSGIKLSEAGEFIPDDDLGRVQRHVGKVVRGLAVKLYDLVDALARKDNIFTYELRSDSKPATIFQSVEDPLQAEDIALKELLLFLMKRSGDTKLKFITDNLEPLEFDPPDAVDGVDAFLKPDGRAMLAQIVAALREDCADLKSRDELLALLGPGANHVYTDEELREMGATDEDLRRESDDRS